MQGEKQGNKRERRTTRMTSVALLENVTLEESRKWTSWPELRLGHGGGRNDR